MKRTDQERPGFLMAAATRLKHTPTEAETVLLAPLTEMGFSYQVPVALPRIKHPERKDWLVLDFYHPGRKLCIEVDGGYHRKRKGRDGRRDRRLAQHGIRTMRITNAEVLGDFDATVALIRYAEGGSK